MNPGRFPGCSILLVIGLISGLTRTNLNGQAPSINSCRWIDSTLRIVRFSQDLSPGEKDLLAERAGQVALLHKDYCRFAMSCITRAPALDDIGEADAALHQLLLAHDVLVSNGCDSLAYIRLLANLSRTYLTLEDFSRVDSVARIALEAWNPAWEDKHMRFAVLNNAGLSQSYQGNKETAGAFFRQLYSEGERDRDTFWIQQSLGNLVAMMGETGRLDSVRYFLDKAKKYVDPNRNFDDYLTWLVNKANLDLELKRYRSAEARLDTAMAMAFRLSSLESRADIHFARSYLYRDMGRHTLAYAALDSFIELNGRILNEERVRAVAEMSERFESERKARIIKQLEVEKLDATVSEQRAQYTRNASLFGGLVVLGLAVGLWSRLRYVRRSRAAIQRQMEVADGLLLNILPASVASELKSSGAARARQYPQATILFSDFQDFTFISSHMDPERLVSEVNTYFKAFDAIARHYGLEKIKTIGDAYMAAAGLEEISQATAADAVRAALAMQAYVAHRAEEMQRQGLPAFEMRMGLHSGPVIAGVVGDSKFQYDLWGDTVNTASRMEGLGETGRVNISDSTYQLVRQDPAFSFHARGHLEVKGKGQMPLYFVSLAVADQGMDRLVAKLASGRQDRAKA